jgi:anti-sigma factor RsiW
MANHVSDWLGAYCDGELHGARLRQIEQHLAECAACQAELNDPRAVCPAARTRFQGGFSPDRALCRQSCAQPAAPDRTTSRPRRVQDRLVADPGGLLGMWIFIEITFSLSSVMKLAANFGLLGRWAGCKAVRSRRTGSARL